MPKTLELKLLGPLEIRRDRNPVTDFKSGKAQALLCYLAVGDRSHSRPALASLLWGDRPEAKARMNLSQALTSLRRRFGAHLEITRQTIAFNRDSDYWLDVAAFEAGANNASAEASIEASQQAVDLYRGDFLDGFHVRDAPDFEAWVLVQRAHLRKLALQTLHRLSLHFTAQGEPGRAKAIDYTTRLLALEPWWEEAHRQLMLLLARAGQRSAALVQYETCRQMLAEELGVEPDMETVELYKQIRDGELTSDVGGQVNGDRFSQAPLPPRSSSPLHNLPPQPTPFIGREEELAEITQRLTDPDCRLLTLVGPGGIGKTRLAVEAAAYLLPNDAFLGGIYFVPLAALNSADFLVSTLAEALDFSFQRGSDPQVQLLDFLADLKQALLLVLDNFEQLAEGADLLADILRCAPAVKLLVTSRERLNLRDEWLLDLRGLPFPPSLQSGKALEGYGAVQIFLQTVTRLEATFALTEADKPYLVRICQLVEGMPLGLELAAAWVRVLSCQEIAQEIEKNIGFLTTSLRDVPARHRSLMAVFDHSWNHLSPEEQGVFRSLAVFRGGFSREAAGQVAGASLPTLSALVDKSMLRRSDSGRYELHELLRQYGGGKLDEAKEMERLRDRHLAFYLKLAEESEPHLWGPDQITWLNQLEIAHDNLREALNWSRMAEGKAEFGLRLAGSLAAFWLSLSYFDEGREHLSAALSRPEALERTAARAKALNKAGLLAFMQTDYPAARPLLEESLSLYRELDPTGRRGLVSTLIRLGDLETKVGDYALSSALMKEALDITRESKDIRGIARVLWQLGHCAVGSGDYEQGVQYLEDALPLWRQLGDRLSTAIVLSILAEVRVRQGNYGLATTLEEESLALRRQAGDNWGIAVSLGNFAWIALRRGDLKQAVTMLGESLTLRREIRDAGGIAWCLEKLAEIALIKGEKESPPQRDADFRRAAQLFGAAEALRARSGSIIDLVDQPEYERQVAVLRTHFDESTFAAAWAEGQSLDWWETVE